MSRPQAAITKMAVQTPTVGTSRIATTPESDITDAIDRSSPPLMIANACPTDITSSGAIWLARLSRLPHERKRGSIAVMMIE